MFNKFSKNIKKASKFKVRAYQKFIMKNRKSKVRMMQIQIKMISLKSLLQKEDTY